MCKDILCMVIISKCNAECSVTKKVRKGGIRSALRTFLIFGSAFGPHWSKKVGILPPGIKKADIYGNLSTIFIL